MSYIRTKDNVYEVRAREKRPDGCVITTSGARIPFAAILCESEYFWKVCDGYYIDTGINTRPYSRMKTYPYDRTQIYDRDELERVLKIKASYQQYSDESYHKYETTVYAFIKTDKGFIFVAKINEKGDPELL